MLASKADLGICICEVATIVSLNFPNVFDKFTIFLSAFATDVKKLISLIIFIFCNFKINPLNNAAKSSAALAKSLNPLVSISNVICLVSFAILDAVIKSSL